MASLRFQRRLFRPAALHRETAPVETAPAAARHLVPHGAGWFESSWELVRGLIVREGLPDDPRLDEWLGAYLVDSPVDSLVDHPIEPTVPTGPTRSQRLASTG